MLERLELKVPPLVLVAVTSVAMWLSAVALPCLSASHPYRLPVAGAILFAGLGIIGLGVLSFRLARTTVNPLDPGSTTSLVTTGVYRWTRNPMYLGFLLVLIAWGVWLFNAISVAWIVLFAWYLQRFQIVPEERALRSIFGAKFGEYARKVRRWL